MNNWEPRLLLAAKTWSGPENLVICEPSSNLNIAWFYEIGPFLNLGYASRFLLHIGYHSANPDLHIKRNTK
jgi:hypothetical protein